MRLVKQPPTTQSERIYALEEGRKADGERLDKISDRQASMETLLTEIHDILVKARGVKWAIDGFFKYAGQISIACGALYGAWKFFTGH